jgi:RNA polymerase sigma-70 factor (ECF subfamily)
MNAHAASRRETPEIEARVGLARLFLAERGRIVQLIRRIVRCRTTAEDLAHDAFLKLWGRGVAEHDRSLLFRTAQNLAIDHVRAQRIRARHVAAVVAERVPAAEAPPAVAAAWREEVASLLEALHALPGRTQRIFLLNRLDGQTYSEIAHALGVSVSTVEKDVIRALDSCRRWLAERSPA